MAPFEMILVKMVASNLDLSHKDQYEFCKSRSAPFEFCSTCIDTSCSRPCCISCVCVQRGGRPETVNGHLNLYLFYSNHKITAYTTAQVAIITVFSPEYIWSLIRGILLII
jgi:hypothetical protein